jgi:hypothetical protein
VDDLAKIESVLSKLGFKPHSGSNAATRVDHGTPRDGQLRWKLSADQRLMGDLRGLSPSNPDRVDRARHLRGSTPD